MSPLEFAEATLGDFCKIKVVHLNFDKSSTNQKVYKPDSYLPHTQLD